MKVKIYTKPNCVQCTATKRAFDRLELPYELVDITDNEQAHQRLTSLGYQTLPVVISPSAAHQWSGYRPDRIAGLASLARIATA
jgi:glutaredoxin-like protein NrdH